MTSRLIVLIILVQMSLHCVGQKKSPRAIYGKELATVELEQSLNDKTLHNVVSDKREIISDSATAVGVAEKILFKIYGQKSIEKQKPYEIYKIKNYWSISGTLPRGLDGGTFLIILDAKDGRIIRVTHGK